MAAAKKKTAAKKSAKKAVRGPSTKTQATLSSMGERQRKKVSAENAKKNAAAKRRFDKTATKARKKKGFRGRFAVNPGSRGSVAAIAGMRSH